ncbi:MAG: hypothetical protein NC543_04915 [bacterium]|nr:hypothetical protein [bacterium]MCM1374880.1 hypothetical protein [Muribaculum sp.]
MEHSVDISVVKENKKEDTVEVYFDIDKFNDLLDNDEKIDYIKSLTKKQYKDVRRVCFKKKDLKELQGELDDLFDVSSMIPNESYEEYLEHENFD